MKKVKVENNIFVVAKKCSSGFVNNILIKVTKSEKSMVSCRCRIRQSVICLREIFQRSVTAFAEPVFR